MKLTINFIAACMLALVHATTLAAADFDQELTAIIRDYDSATYGTPDREARIKAYEAVAKRAERLAAQYPNRAEPLVWQGMGQAEQSGAAGSLGLVKQARKTLEAAVAINPNLYAVDAFSTLGGVYANVPGFPLAFGDKKKAAAYFQKALAINPSSLGANLGYARLLLKLGDYAAALKQATAALNAPPRPGREQADKAERKNAEILIAAAKQQLSS